MNKSAVPAPALLLLLALTAAPVLAAFVFMLLYSLGGIGLLSDGWTLRFWRAALVDGEVWLSLFYSLANGAASLALAVAVALGLQAGLGRQLGRAGLRGLLFIPLAVPALVGALLSVVLFGNAGLFARVAYGAGLIARPEDFPTLLYTASGLGIVLTHVLLVTPFLLLLLDRLARNEGVAALASVARTLGASRFQAWRRVVLPLLLRAAAPTLAVYFVVLVGAFEVPLVLGASHPQMIAVLIQRQFTQFDLGNKPQAYVSACLYAVMSMGMLLALFAWRARRERGGAA